MKILYVATVSGTINAFLMPHIKMLIDSGHDVDVACHITAPLDSRLEEYGCKIHELELSRSPMSKSNYRAYKKFKKIVNSENYDIVHTHTPVASALVRLACKNIKQTKVFYTAHGFHFYQGAPIANWLLYYPLEIWLSNYTGTLITMNKEDYTRAKNKFKAKSIEFVPGVGLNFNNINMTEVKQVSKREELGLSKDDFLILSIGELNKNKNHEVVIRAIANKSQADIHYIICGQGYLEKHLLNISKELGIEKNVHLLGFRKDINEICGISDLFVFPSLREGLPVSLMEAMASGLPVVCSNIRGNSDLIENKKGGYLVKPNEVTHFTEKIFSLYSNRIERKSFGEFNQEKVKAYSLEKILIKLNEIYTR